MNPKNNFLLFDFYKRSVKRNNNNSFGFRERELTKRNLYSGKSIDSMFTNYDCLKTFFQMNENRSKKTNSSSNIYKNGNGSNIRGETYNLSKKKFDSIFCSNGYYRNILIGHPSQSSSRVPSGKMTKFSLIRINSPKKKIKMKKHIFFTQKDLNAPNYLNSNMTKDNNKNNEYKSRVSLYSEIFSSNKNNFNVFNKSNSTKSLKNNQKDALNIESKKNRNYEDNKFLALIPKKLIEKQKRIASTRCSRKQNNISLKSKSYFDEISDRENNDKKILKNFAERYQRDKNNFNRILFDESIELSKKKFCLESFIKKFTNKNFVENLYKAKESL